jgi:hypothetical protein
MSTSLINSGVQFPDGSIQTTASSGGTAFKNRFVNGAMTVNQYTNGAPITINSSTALSSVPVDNISMRVTGVSGGVFGPAVMTAQQNLNNITPPPNFSNYLGYTTVTADVSPAASTQYLIRCPIEGSSLTDLGWGTASAKTVTISFWARSNLTGTFGGTLNNRTPNNFYPFSYTIDSANTWKHVSVTVPPDSVANSINDAISIMMLFSLGVGAKFQSSTTGSWLAATTTTSATSVVGEQQVCAAVGNTFYITGIQFEVGNTATAFDYRPYPVELDLCQRYAQRIGGTDPNEIIGFGNWVTNSAATIVIPLFKPMRSSETLIVSTGTTFCVGFGTTPCSSVAISVSGKRNLDVVATIPNGSQVPGTGCVLRANGTTSTYLIITSGL